MRSQLPRLAAGVALALVLTAGCARGPQPLTVTGGVTVDNNAVKEGLIRFTPDGSGASGSAEGFIRDGRYTAQVFPGKYKVEISSTRPKVAPGKRPPAPGDDEVVETILPRYNRQTTLRAEVVAGKLEHDFPLKSK